MSAIDEALAALEARRAREAAERMRRRQVACDFLRAFHENDVKPSRQLESRGIVASFEGGRLVLMRPEAGEFTEPLLIVAGEQGEIDAGGRSLGRFQPGEEADKTNALIAEIIAHFNF